LSGVLFVRGGIIDSKDDRIFMPIDSIKVKGNEILVSSEELQRFEAVCAKSAVKNDRSEPAKESTRLIENLYKTVAAIAKDAYGHDSAAKKSTTVADILAALEAAGVTLSENTVRDYLKKGAELIER